MRFCSLLLLLALTASCSGEGSGSSYGSAVNADYQFEALECDGPTSVDLSRSGLTIRVSAMSPCAEAHDPAMKLLSELPEPMALAEYESNLTAGAAAFEVSLGLRDFNHHSDAGTLTFSLNLADVSGETLSADTVLARIYDPEEEVAFDVPGYFDGANLVLTTPTLPNHFYAAAIFNPSMRSAASSEIAGGTWPAHRWCVLYDMQNPALVQSTAVLQQTDAPSAAQIEETVQTLILSDLAQAQAAAERAGFAAPNDEIATNAGEPCAGLGVEPRYLLTYELINRRQLAPEGVVLLSVPAYSFGIYSMKSRLLSLEEDSARRIDKAFPTAVNGQITDAVTLVNTKVLGDAPAIAMGNLYQATAQALANAAHNATTAQQQSAVTAQAATTMGVSLLYSIDTASTGTATAAIFARFFKSGGAAPVYTALEDDVLRLDDWLLTSRSAAANQDFFAYVGGRYAGGSLKYLVPMIQEIFLAVEASADAAPTPERRAGLLFQPEMSVVRQAVDNVFQRSLGVSLTEAYLSFITARAVTHEPASILRPGDGEEGFAAGLFHVDAEGVGNTSLVEAAVERGRLSPAEGTFGSIAPFAARAISIPAAVLSGLDVAAVQIQLTSSSGAVGESIQGAVCQGAQCRPLAAANQLTRPDSAAAEQIVVLIANVAMEGLVDVSFQISVQ